VSDRFSRAGVASEDVAQLPLVYHQKNEFSGLDNSERRNISNT